MAINFDGVSAYVEENKSALLTKAILGGKTASLLTLQTGIKSAETLNLLNQTIEYGDGTACGFADAGATTISQRKLEVGSIKINKTYCPATLEGYFTQKSITATAGAESIGELAQQFIDGVLAENAAVLEKAVWRGDKTSSDENLNKFDGLIKILSGATGTTSFSGSTITEGTVIADIKAVYNAIPLQILDSEDLRVFIGADVARMYSNALIAANLYHIVGNEMVVMGTNVKLEVVNGLNGTNVIVAGRLQDMFYGTDLANDAEAVDFWYSKDDQVYKLKIAFKAGVQVSYPGQIVYRYKA